MQTELSMNPGVMQSGQEIYTYSTIQSQLSSFTIGNATQLQTIVIPQSAYNLARSLLSFRMSLVLVAGNVFDFQRYFHTNVIPFFREIRITSGGTQILHLQKLQQVQKVLLPFRKQDCRFVPSAWFQKQNINFIHPQYNYSASVAGSGLKRVYISTSSMEQIQSYLNRPITPLVAGDDFEDNVNFDYYYPQSDSLYNILAYSTLGKAEGSAMNYQVQIPLSAICPFTFVENDVCYEWGQGLLIELQIATTQEIYWMGTRAFTLAANATIDTTAALDALLAPNCSAVANPVQDITVSNFGILIARPTSPAQIVPLRNTQILVPYIYLDYQSGSSNISFTSRVGPGSRGSNLDLQFLTFFCSNSSTAQNFSNSGQYNNAVLKSVGATQNVNSLTSIELFIDNTNVVQSSNPISDFTLQEFWLANLPYDRIPKDKVAYYKDALLFNYAIPFKYYKGDQLLMGKDALQKECTLSFNATLDATNNHAFTFYLISIFTRMMIFDQFGNIQLI